jgi:hypothetical protein
MVAQPENDKIFTAYPFAKRIIEYFVPQGSIFDPCSGHGFDKDGKPAKAFYSQYPEHCNRYEAEIEEGKDCVDFNLPVQWVITNPPYSKAYCKVAGHSFKIANNVVFLTRLDTSLGTYHRWRLAEDQGHKTKEIILVPWKDAGFPPRGFVLAVIHWQKCWRGDCKITSWI